MTGLTRTALRPTKQPRRRVWLAALALAVGVGVGFLMRHPSSPPNPADPDPKDYRSALGPGIKPAIRAQRELANPPATDRAEALRALQAECQLPATQRCYGARCATLLTMPNLESPWGWVTLLGQSPAFVSTVALRDLGAPTDGLPCVQAVNTLVSQPVRAVELTSGLEVWCTGDDEVCNELASEIVGPNAAQFAEPGLRELRLTPL